MSCSLISRASAGRWPLAGEVGEVHRVTQRGAGVRVDRFKHCVRDVDHALGEGEAGNALAWILCIGVAPAARMVPYRRYQALAAVCCGWCRLMPVQELTNMHGADLVDWRRAEERADVLCVGGVRMLRVGGQCGNHFDEIALQRIPERDSAGYSLWNGELGILLQRQKIVGTERDLLARLGPGVQVVVGVRATNALSHVLRQVQIC